MRSIVLTLGLTLGLFAVFAGCTSDEVDTSGADSGTRQDGGTDASTSNPQDGGGPTDAPVADAGPCTSSCATLSGKLGRKASTKPTAGGVGKVYIALFDGNPILDKNAPVVARAVIDNVDLTADDATVDYELTGITPRGAERQVVAFLDDNGNASAGAPAPDKGDLATLDLFAFSGIKVIIDQPTVKTLDLQLNAAVP